ncbi:hypothetical protein FNJ88_04015 [Chryseobacterium sp. SNU WT5]|uniref:hypothetical protein n=1 Tax=Chryseobacterium sp. SNU WT5 TaxID=2594269 RepID=UPI00117E47FE|nr:hypothetical protein [Chryseobacterium sp. SNU WT5]QDP84755.1 hypothetical protein FNJ88_04015 [Chryseobacterium sp. SNU WT5]
MKKINKNLGIPYAVGYILAGVVLIPLLIFAVNKFYFQGNDVEKYINQYIKNTTELKVKIDLNSNSSKEDFKSIAEGKGFTFGHEIYTAYLSKRGGKIYIDKIGFYAKEYNKFFVIRITNMGDNYHLSNVINNKNVVLTVNKDDMKNPKMGTKANPIPVFKVVGENPLLIDFTSNTGKTTYENLDITEAEYENSVYVHLKYVMSKKEFKERFEKNK